MIDLRQGDNRAKLRQMIADGEFVDSVVTDPPYGIAFMGKKWDSTSIERDPEFWSLVWQVMKPGAYIIAFSSSRTYGYMQVAMEAAGFITHPMFGWVTNQGFPKGHDVGKAIDAQMLTGGSGPKNIRQLDMGDDYVPHPLAGTPGYGDGRMSRGADTDRDYTKTQGLQTDEAKQWQGWKTGTQSLKPALEPVYFGQKSFSEKTGAANVLKHGVGAVNIDACRVPTREARPKIVSSSEKSLHTFGDGLNGSRADGTTFAARYPANLVHDGSPEVVALFPQSSGQQGDVRGTEPSRTGDENTHCYGEYGSRPPVAARNDVGSAARFFNSFPHEGPIMCNPKARKADRAGSKHATVKPVDLMGHFERLVTPPGGLVLDPFAGTGTTGEAALRNGFRCILMEAEPEYARDIRRRFGLPMTVSDTLVYLSDAFQ